MKTYFYHIEFKESLTSSHLESGTFVADTEDGTFNYKEFLRCCVEPFANRIGVNTNRVAVKAFNLI